MYNGGLRRWTDLRGGTGVKESLDCLRGVKVVGGSTVDQSVDESFNFDGVTSRVIEILV